MPELSERWDNLFFGSSIMPKFVMIKDRLRAIIVKSSAVWYVGEFNGVGSIVAIKQICNY